MAGGVSTKETGSASLFSGTYGRPEWWRSNFFVWDRLYVSRLEDKNFQDYFKGPGGSWECSFSPVGFAARKFNLSSFLNFFLFGFQSDIFKAYYTIIFTYYTIIHRRLDFFLFYLLFVQRSLRILVTWFGILQKIPGLAILAKNICAERCTKFSFRVANHSMSLMLSYPIGFPQNSSFELNKTKQK